MLIVVCLPVAEHGVRLARARLAVREDAHLVPVQRAGHQVRDILEHLLLARARVENAVEGKVHGLLLLPGLRDAQRSARRFARSRDFEERLGVVFAASRRCGIHVFARVCVHGPNAAKNADVPLEFLHLVMQRAPDDGVLANLKILREHQSLEFGAPRLELLRASLLLLRAAREGRRAGGGLRELSTSRRQRRALLLVRHAKRLQARPQRRSLGGVLLESGAFCRLLLGVLLKPLDLLRRRVQLRAQHLDLRLSLGRLTLERVCEVLQLQGMRLRGDALGVRVGAAIASLIPGGAQVLRLGSRDFRVCASLGEFRAQSLDARLQRSSVRLQRLDLV
mmetsp:Transcript_5296/g.21399  ORF Transcript_5296/g.21399 Transcript_5296/m.21399 type:complete len:336 (+) Transcript_5296:823-1830(+)